MSYTCPNCGEKIREAYSENFKMTLYLCDNEECKRAFALEDFLKDQPLPLFPQGMKDRFI